MVLLLVVHQISLWSNIVGRIEKEGFPAIVEVLEEGVLNRVGKVGHSAMGSRGFLVGFRTQNRSLGNSRSKGRSRVRGCNRCGTRGWRRDKGRCRGRRDSYAKKLDVSNKEEMCSV